MLALYFQGYEITMQDLIPEEDKVSSNPLPSGHTRSTKTGRRSGSLVNSTFESTFADGVCVAAQAACGVRPGYQLCEQNQGTHLALRPLCCTCTLAIEHAANSYPGSVSTDTICHR